MKDLERLREENHALNEEMQRFVRTERRLSLSRYDLDQQVKRTEALNQFSLEASRAENIPQVLRLSLEVLFSLLPFEQGIAYLKTGEGYRPAVSRSIAGRESRAGRVAARVIAKGTLPRTPKAGYRRDLARFCPSLCPFLHAFEQDFGAINEEGDPADAAYLVLPVHLREGVEALVLLRRATTRTSYFEHLPRKEDCPFLSLFCAHLSSAFENIIYYQAMRASEKEAHLRAEENERLLKEARAAVRARDEFLSLASHELRTPVTSLKNELQLLQVLAERGSLALYPKPRLLDLVRIGDRELARLAKLINGMLEVTRITSGKLQLNPEPVEFGPLIREMVKRLDPEIRQTGSPVTLDLHDHEPGIWDRLRIEQVVTNLLTNALKYGKGRPITITSETRQDKAILKIEDHGIGISPEDQKKIFERFERAVSEVQTGGLGLGLYLTRQIVQAHQGVIAVSSTPGRGSTFTVEIPLKTRAVRPPGKKAA